MADNVTLNSGSGGETLATDDVGGNQYQRIKISDGEADSSTHLDVKAVDEASGGGDTGIVSLGVRDDSLATLTPVDGDFTHFRTNNRGAQWVEHDGTIEVVGGAADSAAISGNPVLLGGYAVSTDGTDPSEVTEGDAAALRSDVQRVLLVNETPPRFFNAHGDYASAQTNATVQAAPGAGLKLYITDVIISNGATAGNITLLDGSGGSVLLECYPAVNGGVTHRFRSPLVLTANTLLAITSTTVTTHSVTISGYIAP